jgi:glycosyltransferase involved in cell wall biosynthesis
MRLLFCGDLAPTGFGSVTTDLGRALLDKGVDVRFLSQNDFPTLPEPFLSRTLDVATFPIIPPSEAMPQGGIDYDAMQNLLGKIVDGTAGRLHIANGESWGEWKPEAILLLGDYYGIRLTVDKAGLEPFQKVPTFHYCPIEGHDLPPNWRGLWDIIKPIAMSKFGQDEMEKVLGYRPPMFYHGIDTDTFRPITPTEPLSIVTPDRTVVLSSKEMCKRFFGINPHMKLLLRCDANMPRKAYPALLRALAPILTGRPDVTFVMKTSNYDQGGYLLDSISKLPQHVYDRIHLLESKLPREGLVALYNAADVYVSNSSEGFGLSIGEALACGVPAVARASA